jgi:DNA primase
VWHCHTRCAAKGNLVTLLMKKYQCPFQQAVVWLAKFAGIEISGPILNISPAQIEEESLEMMKRKLGIVRHNGPVTFDESWVAQSQQGWQLPGAAAAVDFLTGPVGTRNSVGDKRKGFPWEVIQRFEVGFVPSRRWTMADPETPNKQMGWFTDRISIPWRMVNGQLIGFSGRRLDGQKYMKFQNFPYTKKAFALYGLHLPETQAAIQKERVLILVEGYGDKWRSWQYGIHNVGAVGGTELTPEQIQLIASFDLDSVILFYDGDTAGVTTSRKMSDQLVDITKVRLASCPEGYDPDELPDRDAYLHPLIHSRSI